MRDCPTLGDVGVGGIPLASWLGARNRRICEHVSRDARNLQVGHAYLFDGGKPAASLLRLARIIHEDVIPLLQEYCYEDYSALENILGKGLVDRQTQRIRDELFEEARQDELIQALLAPCPDLATTAQATALEMEPLEEEEGETEAEGGDDESA